MASTEGTPELSGDVSLRLPLWLIVAADSGRPRVEDRNGKLAFVLFETQALADEYLWRLGTGWRSVALNEGQIGDLQRYLPEVPWPAVHLSTMHVAFYPSTQV